MFLIIESELLKNVHYITADKVIVAFLGSLKKSGKKFNGSLPWLATNLGMTEMNLKKRLKILMDLSIVVKEPDGYTLFKSPIITYTLEVVYDNGKVF